MMNVSLTPALDKMVQKKVATGLYNSASEVIRAALRLLEEQEQLKKIKLKELRKEISVGIDQANRGELHEGKEVFQKIREKNRRIVRAKK